MVGTLSHSQMVEGCNSAGFGFQTWHSLTSSGISPKCFSRRGRRRDDICELLFLGEVNPNSRRLEGARGGGRGGGVIRCVILLPNGGGNDSSPDELGKGGCEEGKAFSHFYFISRVQLLLFSRKHPGLGFPRFCRRPLLALSRSGDFDTYSTCGVQLCASGSEFFVAVSSRFVGDVYFPVFSTRVSGCWSYCSTSSGATISMLYPTFRDSTVGYREGEGREGRGSLGINLVPFMTK